MNYTKHYNLLIERAKIRILNDYTERHHIIPKCMGGNNAKENIARLTPEEHFVAHQLLVKIYPNNAKLVFAVLMMTRKSHNRSNKIYGWIRRKLVETQRNKIVSLETRKKIGLHSKGKQYSLGLKRSEETKLKISLSKTGKPSPNQGKPLSEEHKQKMRKPKTDDHKRKLSEANLKPETRKRLSEINTGRQRTNEQKTKQSKIMKGRYLGVKRKPLDIDTKTKISKSKKTNNFPLGINFDKNNNKYRVRRNGIHIGRYKTLEEAINAFNNTKE